MSNLSINMRHKIANSFVLRPLRQLRRRYVFNRAWAAYQCDPDSFCSWTDEQVHRFLYGWGNEDFAASTGLLRAAVKLSLDQDVNILECGSGLSTLLIAAIGRNKGKFYSLEHDRDWYMKLQRTLKNRKVDQGVKLCYAPLKDYGKFDWYGIDPNTSLADSFQLVVCDGPPPEIHEVDVGAYYHSLMRD